MKVSYDAEADALYIQFRELAPGSAECRPLSDEVIADYGPDGKIAGLEVLDASVVLGVGAQKLTIEVAPVAEPAPA